MGPLGALGWPCPTLWSMSSSPPLSSFPHPSPVSPPLLPPLPFFITTFLPFSNNLLFFLLFSISFSSLTPSLVKSPSLPPCTFFFILHPSSSLSLFTFSFYSSLTQFLPFPNSFIPPPHPFSISTASLINNASQRIKNISRVLLAVKEREETRERKEWVTPFWISVMESDVF